MAETIQMKAYRREKSGKGAARRERKAGRVPGVVYGDRKEPILISVDFPELYKHALTGRFESTLVELDVEGEKILTLPRDVQLDPVKDLPIHVDFLRLGKGARITVEVPVEYVGEENSPGIRRGGVLNVVRHEVEVWCDAQNIPEKIVADISDLDIGDSLHISQVQLPEGVTPYITDRDFTLATIAGTIAEEGEEGAEGEEGEEGAEGE
ncbi:50S ribosomal protein L25/general stress protein Ctc [Thermopetrobacter sp. TC1]|uniref:50S ribosomal protein L25/general stress protein Ctc n=1 Tax=Thermopetrobacter sp. TC1 TaxID=1495045 RepID=UPI00056DB681|nr:50S ribosomal protein L25/general stress protein Ctc [Thermopetrobacter sp. TC1]